MNSSAGIIDDYGTRKTPRFPFNVRVLVLFGANAHSRIERALEQNIAWLLCVTALLIAQTILIFTHRPWLDEWQALQITLQSPDFRALLENLRYEGHPPLWYLYLQAVSYVVPTAYILPVAQFPIAMGIQALMLTRSQFTRLERLLIVSSVIFIFDYGVLSRSLSMGVFLTISAFAFRNRYAVWISAALMPLTDFLFGVLSIAWLILARAERRLWAPGLGAWALCSLISAWTVRPATDMIPALWNESPLYAAVEHAVNNALRYTGRRDLPHPCLALYTLGAPPRLCHAGIHFSHFVF
jgi:hypothetical protein